MIETFYAIVSFMLVVYVVLDGRNFGAGMLHAVVAKTPAERRQVIAAMGPLWSWHEVWLVAFGGVTFAAFPRLLAGALEGYYLAIFLILWCFVLRGISIEFGGHINDRLWQGFWDFVFVVSNVLLAVLFGAAGGNIVRGVPLDDQGQFSMAFFTNFGVRGNVGLLDWYTLSVAAVAVVMLAGHGATYLTLRTEGPVHDRSARCANMLWLAVCPLGAVVSLETWYVRPDMLGRAIRSPGAWVGLAVVVVAAAALFSGLRTRCERRAFLGSTFLIAGLLGAWAAAIFPVFLHSTLKPEDSMTAYAAASSHSTLLAALIWWPIGMALAASYFIFISRRYSGKVSVVRDNQGYY